MVTPRSPLGVQRHLAPPHPRGPRGPHSEHRSSPWDESFGPVRRRGSWCAVRDRLRGSSVGSRRSACCAACHALRTNGPTRPDNCARRARHGPCARTTRSGFAFSSATKLPRTNVVTTGACAVVLASNDPARRISFSGLRCGGARAIANIEAAPRESHCSVECEQLAPGVDRETLRERSRMGHHTTPTERPL